MIQQIYYEFRKHFIKPSVFVVLLVFLLLNAFQISAVYHEKSVFSMVPEFKDGYKDLYSVYGGSITEEKIKNLMSNYHTLQAEGNRHLGSEYQNAMMLQLCFVKPMQYFYEYRQNAEKVAESALDNMGFYQRVGNMYASRQNQQIAEMFSKRWIPGFRYTEVYQHYLQYDFSIFLVLLIVIYGLVNVFVLEKETEMEMLLRTTLQGKRKSARAKILASVLFTITVSLLFWIADFVLFGCLFGSFDGGNCPVYAVEYFGTSPLSISLFTYALFTMALKTVGVVAFGMIILLLSCLCKSTLLPFVGSVVLIGNCLVAYNADLPSVCNPVSLLVCRELFHWTRFINLGGIPVLTWQVCLGTTLLAMAGLTIVILYVTGKGVAIHGYHDL